MYLNQMVPLMETFVQKLNELFEKIEKNAFCDIFTVSKIAPLGGTLQQYFS